MGIPHPMTGCVVAEPPAQYDDPEHGNRIYYWDFGKEPASSSYEIRLALRLESYEIEAVVDTERIEPYDTTSAEYRFYTKSGHTTHITPEIRELARIAIGDEGNPYVQAQQTLGLVQERMRYEITTARGTDFLLTTAAAVADLPCTLMPYSERDPLQNRLDHEKGISTVDAPYPAPRTRVT